METFLGHFHLKWKRESKVDGLFIFSAFPSQQIFSISKILSNNGIDDTVSFKSLGPNELRKILSYHLPNHPPVKPRDLYSSGPYPKKARDQINNRHISRKKAQNNQIAIITIERFPNINRLTIKMSMA